MWTTVESLWTTLLASPLAGGLGEARPAYTLRGHEDNVEALTFSPDNTLLASVSQDRTLRVWRLSD